MRVVPQKFVADDGTSFNSAEECAAYEDAIVKKGMIQWKFSFVFRRELKDQYKPTTTGCPSCGGAKVVGGGFGDPDGPTDCPRCFGTGYITNYNPDVVQAPPIPPGLDEAMTKAWNEWWASYKT